MDEDIVPVGGAQLRQSKAANAQADLEEVVDGEAEKDVVEDVTLFGTHQQLHGHQVDGQAHQAHRQDAHSLYVVDAHRKPTPGLVALVR